MQNKKVKKLKPCPFCGRSTVTVLPYMNNKYILSHWYTNKVDCPIATADMYTGIGSTCFDTEDEAITTWNKRVSK